MRCTKNISSTESRIAEAVQTRRLAPESTGLHQEHPGTQTCTTRKPNKDRSLNDSRPEVRSFLYRSFHSIDSDPEQVSHIVT